MIEMTHTVTIGRPIREVFEFVRDQRNESKWHTDVTETDGEGPVNEGDLVTWTVRFMGSSQYVSEVTRVDEPNLIQLEARSGPLLPTLTHRFEGANGETHYTRHVSIPPSGLFRIVGPIMKLTGAAARRNATFAENLKELLDTA